MTFRSVRAIGLRLPGVEESTVYGSPALKLSSRLIACIASHQSAEPNTLVVRTDFEQRDALIDEEGAHPRQPHEDDRRCLVVPPRQKCRSRWSSSTALPVSSCS